jgi:penicillin-binding protein 1C
VLEAKEAEKGKGRRKGRRLRVRVLRCFLVLGLVGLFGWYVLPWCFSLPEGLEEGRGASPVLLDRNGETMRFLTAEDFTRSAPVGLEGVPRVLIDCTLAAEDKRFYEHGGIDLVATVRSAYDFVRYREVVSGASTITQQLAKLSRPRAERNLWSKFMEAMVARRLEMTWEKERILEEYFNRLDYGNLRISPTEAARFYFQKPLTDLSLGESALLAGLPQAPSRLNPLKNLEDALERREVVLDRLLATGKYEEGVVEMARGEELRLRPLRERKAAPWLNRFPGGDEKMRTTLDLGFQEDVEGIVREEVAKLKAANLRHAGVVVIDNATGDILAMVSSADWEDKRGGQIHGAMSPRSPGSTLKPFTYLLSFRELGNLPSDVIGDIPTRLRTDQGLQLPENYDRRYRGPVTIRTALACSLNVPALRELEALGGPKRLHDFLEELGISTLTEDSSHYGLGLTLGNAPVRLLELTNAYAVMARGGDFLPTRLFMDEERVDAVRCIDGMHSWLMADILSDKEARAPAFGVGGPLDLPFRCAVKTGTSSDFRDNWCVGFTPEFTVGVWAGNFENQPMKDVSGVAGAGPIFHRTMVRVHRDREARWYGKPEGMVQVRIDRRTGKRLEEGFKADHAVLEWVPKGVGIEMAAVGDYDEEGRAMLEPMYRDWFMSTQNQRRNELAMDEGAESRMGLQILRPQNNTTILLDPDMPGDSSRLQLLTNMPEHVVWECESLEIEGETAKLVAGEHVLIATDRRDGTRHEVWISVKSL